MKKARVATLWLDGCSGCHMSILDIDEAIAAVAQKADIVYGPLVDAQEFPEDVDVTLVEGAVSSQDDYEKIKHVRENTRLLVALGDCAVTSNVPAMRNSIPVKKLLDRIYVQGVDAKPRIPSDGVPTLLKRAIHEARCSLIFFQSWKTNFFFSSAVSLASTLAISPSILTLPLVGTTR